VWDFLGEVVRSLPPWFLIALIVAAVVIVLYMLPRVRWDKNGKPYLYSRSYEYQKNRVKEQIEMSKTLHQAVDGMDKRLRSVECENLKQTFYIDNAMLPKEERLIAGLKYVYNGRNGKVREDVARFVKENPDVYTDVITKFPQWALAQGKAEA
jgi:hypothetical protein